MLSVDEVQILYTKRKNSMELVENLKSSNFVWLILSFCTFIGLPLSIYLHHRSIKKTINAILSSNELIVNRQPNFSKINILYDNRDVDGLTVTKLTFWNKTASPIRKSDIIDAAPLSILSKNGEILDVSVLNGENTPNKIGASLINDTTVHITFDYLNKKEGGIIQIIHTGNHNAIDITRQIIGGEIKVKKVSDLSYRRSVYASLILALLIFSLYQYSDNWIVALLVSIMIILLTVLAATFNYKDLYKDYVPKNCRKNFFHKTSTPNEYCKTDTKSQDI